MVRQILIMLIAVSALFTLVSCGNSDFQGATPIMDSTDSFDQKAKEGKPYKGKGENYTGEISSLKVSDEEAQEPQPDLEAAIFEEKPDLEVDWTANRIRLEGKIGTMVNGKQVLKNVVYEGSFNKDVQAAILKPKEKGATTLAVFRCKGTCDEVIVDVSLRDEENHDVEKKQQVKFNVPSASGKIVEPYTSGILNSAAILTAEEPAAKKSDKKSTETQKTKQKEDPKVATQNQELLDQLEDVEEDTAEEFNDPAVPAGVPFMITGDMLDQLEKGEEVDLAKSHGTELFPVNLGLNYKGKALGFYNTTCVRVGKNSCGKRIHGSLANGTDVAVNLENKSPKDQKGIGYSSVQRQDKVFFGSGLLVKMIEEAGKAYDKVYPGDAFKVNDLSKESGGNLRKVCYSKRKKRYYTCGGHASHQNGLDVDISLPRITKGKSVTFEYDKVWTIIKTFVDYGFVDVIFLNPARINELCRYLQKNEKDYQETFKKIYKESGHKTHIHVRLKCTAHNQGCIESRSESYTASQFGVCK